MTRHSTDAEFTLTNPGTAVGCGKGIGADIRIHTLRMQSRERQEENDHALLQS
jgi:hypothetical protein